MLGRYVRLVIAHRGIGAERAAKMALVSAGHFDLDQSDAAPWLFHMRRSARWRAVVDVLLHPKVTLEADSDIEKARALHEKAHTICVVANSMNFPVEVIFAEGSMAAA